MRCCGPLRFRESILIDNHSHLHLSSVFELDFGIGVWWMYICICHGVNEATIREAVQNGSRTVRELSFQTGCGTQCGSCLSGVQTLLMETLRTEQAASYSPFLRIVSVS